MLTTEEFYITEEVKDEILQDKERYHALIELMCTVVENHHIIFIKEEISKRENLHLMICLSEDKENFYMNAYYYLINQITFYEQNDLALPNATELANKDLIEIFEQYNQKRLTFFVED
jgi:hypothetical protein